MTLKQEAIDFITNTNDSEFDFNDYVISTYDDDYIHMCSKVNLWEKSFDTRQDAVEFIQEV